MAISHAVLRISLTLVVKCIYFINLPVVHDPCPSSGRKNTTSETHTCKTLLYSTRIVLAFTQHLPAVSLSNDNTDSILNFLKSSGSFHLKIKLSSA